MRTSTSLTLLATILTVTHSKVILRGTRLVKEEKSERLLKKKTFEPVTPNPTPAPSPSPTPAPTPAPSPSPTPDPFSPSSYCGGNGEHYLDAFEAFRQQTDSDNDASHVVWPVPDSTREMISSTFGPRVKITGSRYDWHQGIDISCNGNNYNILAIYGGKVKNKDYSDSGGGNTVVIEHDFPVEVEFHEDKFCVTKWYSRYLHLDTIDDSVVDEQPISKGQVLGTCGRTGDASAEHLHYEIRIGTRCSLRYAVENPNSTCNMLDFDPHVHPLLLYPKYADPSQGSYACSVTLIDDISPALNATIGVTCSDEEPNNNRYYVKILDVNDNFKLDWVLDLNLRTGFDATDIDALDTPDKTRPFLDPLSFGVSASTWTTHYVIPGSWLPVYQTGDKFEVTIADIFGHEYSLSGIVLPGEEEG